MNKCITADELADFLDKTLDVAAWQDVSHNGLQVAANGPVRRICCGVDADMAFFEAAAVKKADFLICHHGLSWGDSLSRITGLNYRRIKFLLAGNTALYACHLPLDAHPEFGNNAQLCSALKLRNIRKFGNYHGSMIGFSGLLPRPMPLSRFKVLAAGILQSELRTMEFGPKVVRSVAVVSGGAADLVEEAGKEHLDVFLSGEPTLQAWSLAREYGVNALFGGHYATETFGVRALAHLLAREFKLKTEFIGFAVPF